MVVVEKQFFLGVVKNRPYPGSYVRIKPPTSKSYSLKEPMDKICVLDPIISKFIQKLTDTPVVCCNLSIPRNEDCKHFVGFSYRVTGTKTSPLSGLTVKTPGLMNVFVHVTLPTKATASWPLPLASDRQYEELKGYQSKGVRRVPLAKKSPGKYAGRDAARNENTVLFTCMYPALAATVTYGILAGMA